MANLVLGIGSSHGPTIQTPPEDWVRLGVKDTRDPRFDYQGLLRDARPGLDTEIAIERQRERHAANQAGLEAVARVISEAHLDVIVIVSNPHRTWADDNQPVFAIFRGDPLVVSDPHGPQRDPDLIFQAGVDDRPKRELLERPAAPELANHLINALIAQNVDVGCTDALRSGTGLDEAFTLLYERFTADGNLPMVPFMLSRYRPNQATPRRCYAVGRALGRAIESWDSDVRVGIMASGGLSHQIIDEELDHTVIDAMMERDEETLSSLSVERLNRAGGTPEILNWVTVTAAMEPVGMTLIDYVPCYRSLAGTGHGVTFGYWK
ncbi:MAG: hypothetical protein GEU73_01040 [Chloroflexi bacterium]|nr:hypothetical protein [Chloroflexota bacterium]